MTVPAGETPSGLVSVDELCDYMNGISLTENQRNTVAGILLGVQQELEIWLNRPVELVQVREVVSDIGYDGMIYTSITPVTKIISVFDMSGSPIYVPVTIPYVPPVMTRDPDLPSTGRLDDRAQPSFDVNMNGSPGGFLAGYDYAGGPFVVEYIGGYAGHQDEALKTAIMRVAAREATGLFDDSLAIRGGNAEDGTENTAPVKGWMEDELLQFDRIRRRVVV